MLSGKRTSLVIWGAVAMVGACGTHRAEPPPFVSAADAEHLRQATLLSRLDVGGDFHCDPSIASRPTCFLAKADRDDKVASLRKTLSVAGLDFLRACAANRQLLEAARSNAMFADVVAAVATWPEVAERPSPDDRLLSMSRERFKVALQEGLANKLKLLDAISVATMLVFPDISQGIATVDDERLTIANGVFLNASMTRYSELLRQRLKAQ
jgi:hypothetical protein